MSCRCEVPRESPNPRSAGSCMVCGKIIERAWTSNDETVKAFFDHLERTFPGSEPPPDFAPFRQQCEAREREGHSDFGHAFLGRDNCIAATEEAADFAIYMLLDTLKALREGGTDDDSALAMQGAIYAYKAHRTALQLRAKRRGAP